MNITLVGKCFSASGKCDGNDNFCLVAASVLQLAITGSVQVTSELVSTVSVASMLVLAAPFASVLVGRMAVERVLVATVELENVLVELEAVTRVFVKTVTVESLLMGAMAECRWQVCWCLQCG